MTKHIHLHTRDRGKAYALDDILVRTTVRWLGSAGDSAFTPGMIETLRAEYSKIGTVDPGGAAYAKLTALLDRLSQEQLKQLAEAGIKFVSKLALNRVTRDALPSRNTGWGFYGTIRQQKEDEREGVSPAAERRFASVQSQIVALFGLTNSEARDFLDSRRGRHLADEIGTNGDVAKVKWLASEIARFKREYDPKAFDATADDAAA